MTITLANLACMALTGVLGILAAHELKNPKMMQRRVQSLKSWLTWWFNDGPWPYVLLSCFIVVSFVSWIFQ